MIRQTDFRAGLLDPARPAPTGLMDRDRRAAGKRYDIYRNNVTVGLTEAMKAAFPLVEKLIGTQNFAQLALLFARKHPPTSPMLMFYGVEFPSFIQGFAPLSHIGYLSDAARLDLALRQSYHAADSPAFDPSPFQLLSAEALLDATITLAPSTRLLPSKWPLFDIWRYNQRDDAPAPQNVAQDVLIARAEFDPVPYPLPLGAAFWFKQLQAGTAFGAAQEAALAAHPEFDLTSSLTLALSSGALAKIHHKDLI